MRALRKNDSIGRGREASSAPRRRRLFWFAVGMVAVILALPIGARAQTTLTIAAAISLRDAMPKLVRHFSSKGYSVTVTYGASGKLRRQVEGGAPIDVVVFASAQHVDLLAQRGLLVDGSRRVIATNSLVLIGPKGSPPLTFETIERVPKGEMIAIGEPDSVPAGRYARDALIALGKWQDLQGRVVFGGHVAAVLQYARRGEVAAAVVYATDVAGVADVVVLDRAKGSWSPRVETVAAAVKGGNTRGAQAFLELVASDQGRAVLAAHGFGPPDTEVAEAKP